ncbi:MAG: YkgJ family cysteine cluster protein [Methanocalculaceae archaeon]|nr:YkgJ family cysteine cluster protein [Methanocalculaceae archaeon]
MSVSPETELAALRTELTALQAYPEEKLEEIIAEVGFSCTCCGRCCTRVFNGHVFLLSADTERLRRFAPEMLMPAPDFPYSDSLENFYVSGYALRTKQNGDCVFFSEERKCTIYEDRFSICRIYPYMLHCEPDSRGHVDWRQISGLDEHGEYDTVIPPTETAQTAAAVIAYETAYLEQEIAFHEAVIAKFSQENIRFVRRDHDRRTREFLKGDVPAVVYVWDGKTFSREEAVPAEYR